MPQKFFLFLTLFFFSVFIQSCHTAQKASVPWQSETKNEPLKIVVISDLNASYGETTYPEDVPAVIALLDSIKPNLVLCAGDMVAGQKATLTEQNITDMWRSFKTTVLTPIEKQQIPFGFTVGNHDASPSFALDRRLARDFWQQNACATHLTFVDSTHYPFYYSFVENGVFFISWDAAGAQIPAAVYSWMQAQLKSITAKKARLRILLGHLPLYPIVESKNKPGEIVAASDSALRFFKVHKIDVYISGHQHAYFPAQKEGVRLFNAGAIGNGPRPILGHSAPAQKAYSIIQVPVHGARQFTHQTFVPITNTVIDIRSLPDSVVGFNGILKREDVRKRK
jgi:predicted phosphodiesterase